MNRREFLCATSAAAGAFVLYPKGTFAVDRIVVPDADFERLASDALEAARSAGAQYADIRINRYHNQYVTTREERLLGISDQESFGFGIRVLVGGAWGFAAGTTVTREQVVKAARTAVDVARANIRLQREPVELAPVQAYREEWRTPIQVDALAVPAEEKVELLLGINAEALKAKGTRFCRASLFTAKEDKFFASTEGSLIRQEVHRIWPSFSVTAISEDGSDFQSRSGLCQPMGRGYEYLREYPLLEEARQAGEDAVAKLKAPTVEPGMYDLVLLPSHTWLVIHESIGHATELDRALGFEANYAGTSFVTPDLLNNLRYGSDWVNVVGDRTEQYGLATVGFDDEGVKTGRFDIIRNGEFVGYQTIREQAGWVGDTESHACAYADSYEHVPMQRMPNVSLMPSDRGLTPDDLIAGVDDGIMIAGDGSWSIDQQRRNFQFGGQVFHRIRGGKIVGMLRDVAYQSTTPEFWNSCDGVCSKEYYELGGSYFCGKGQPPQVAPVSHGSAPARFRGINVINTKRNV